MEFKPYFTAKCVDGFEDYNEHKGAFDAEVEYDAINDETFGINISDLNEDLEEFANRTANLILEEPYSSVLKDDNNEYYVKKSCENLKEKSDLLGAKTLEEIERKHISASQEINQSKVKPILLSAEELERQMLLESKLLSNNDVNNKNSNNQLSTLIQEANVSLPHSFLTMKNLTNYFSVPPPNFPTANSNVMTLPYNKNNETLQNLITPIDFGYSKQNSLNKNQYVKKIENASNFQSFVVSTNEATNLHKSLESLTFNVSHQTIRQNRQKIKGLPSFKTISDFAFDPYAGFMSKREREWLIKVHLIQCMGTGDLFEDDFYYTVWKKKNVLKKAPESWNKKICPRYYSFDDTCSTTAYAPPSFTGTLGKPTHCSAKIPRQIIDLSMDGIDEEETENNLINQTMQKKLKAMLMRIENTALALLECSEIKRKLASGIIKEDENVLEAVLKNKINIIFSSICSDDLLPTMMLIQKGRTLLFQIMDFCTQENMFNILKIMIQSLPRCGKKIPDNSVHEFSKHVFLFISSLTKQQLIELTNIFNFDLQTLKSTKQKISIFEIFQSTTLEWLNLNSTDDFNCMAHIFLEMQDLFLTENIIFLKQWLSCETLRPESMAYLLAKQIDNLLLTKNKSL